MQSDRELRMKYPIGIQDFEKIRKEGYLYIDKTSFIYQMVNGGSYYFLSRPRRFGKSLLVSTLEAYFKGKKELFEGLAMQRLEKEWKVYPVLHLDLNSEDYKTAESLYAILNNQLVIWEQKYGSAQSETTVASRFMGIIRRACEKSGLRVVVLVDEYDKPLLQTLGNEDLQTEYRNTLKAFYGALKSCDRYIQFALLTGVTKFGRVSVFSDLNNLEDLSMDRRYVELCGISENEVRQYLDDAIDLLAAQVGKSKEECLLNLKQRYDGYHFSSNSIGMFNPFSVLNTLKKQQFGDYWFETGTPTFLVELLKKSHYILENLTREHVTSDVINSIDSLSDNPVPILYQSGYLTIKGYDERFRKYHLGFPNQEVEQGFVNFLAPYYTGMKPTKSAFYVENFVSDIENGDAEGFMKRLEAMFADNSYQIAGDEELYFQNAVYIIFKMLGFYVDVERPTSDGRIDVLIRTPQYIYIFELKVNQSADVALQQIEEKQYAAPFALEQRRLFKIGVNFSTKTRKISEWKIERE